MYSCPPCGIWLASKIEQDTIGQGRNEDALVHDDGREESFLRKRRRKIAPRKEMGSL